MKLPSELEKKMDDYLREKYGPAVIGESGNYAYTPAWEKWGEAREVFNAACEILLPLIENGKQMAEFYGDTDHWYDHSNGTKDLIDGSDLDEYDGAGELIGGKKARAHIKLVEETLGGDNE